MRIAILYICTGKYSIFWNTFFQTCEEFFLKNVEKHYFVFTDDDTIKESENIHPVYQSPRGFPLDSLMRFEMFIKIEDRLENFDYIFFLNSNVKMVAEVGNEVLPGKDNEGLVGVIHAGYLNSKPFWMPFERKKKSTAYIGPGMEKYTYYLGGINGGISKNFTEMIKVCRDNIQSDLNNGYTAFYHDESHINHYFADKNILQLSPSYGYPEDWELPYEPKIMILNKVKHGGFYFDKLPAASYMKRSKLFLKRFTAGLLWYFK